jgi:putative spermidine/putrescine transport system ATP-binding protein
VANRPPDLIVEGLGKRFGATVALDGVDLRLPGGSLSCLVGPSGCGKTTLLRIIAGLEVPSAGRVRLGEDDLTHVPVERRGVGMVFQSYALFPHLSVAENVAYGLRIRGVPRRTRLARAHELLERVRLPDVAARRVSQLSGGQRQRVAMARALALDPALFLLDEPLSALDAKLRTEMQVELRRLQRELGITTIIVTHDQEEAMTMADAVVVMSAGRVQQSGAPLDVYRRPDNRFVADFLGVNNLLPARMLASDRALVMERSLQVLTHAAPAVGEEAVVAIRPERLRLHDAPPDGAAAWPGVVTFVRDLGRVTECRVRVADVELIVVGDAPRPEGATVWVAPPEHGAVALRP